MVKIFKPIIFLLDLLQYDQNNNLLNSFFLILCLVSYSYSHSLLRTFFVVVNVVNILNLPNVFHILKTIMFYLLFYCFYKLKKEKTVFNHRDYKRFTFNVPMSFFIQICTKRIAKINKKSHNELWILPSTFFFFFLSFALFRNVLTYPILCRSWKKITFERIKNSSRVRTFFLLHDIWMVEGKLKVTLKLPCMLIIF